MNLAEPQRVDQFERIAGQVVEAVGTLRHAARAMPARVVGNDPVTRGERVDLGMPHAVIAEVAVAQHDSRRALRPRFEAGSHEAVGPVSCGIDQPTAPSPSRPATHSPHSLRADLAVHSDRHRRIVNNHFGKTGVNPANASSSVAPDAIEGKAHTSFHTAQTVQ